MFFSFFYSSLGAHTSHAALRHHEEQRGERIGGAVAEQCGDPDLRLVAGEQQ